jgi:hypothetical protein
VSVYNVNVICDDCLIDSNYFCHLTGFGIHTIAETVRKMISRQLKIVQSGYPISKCTGLILSGTI